MGAAAFVAYAAALCALAIPGGFYPEPYARARQAAYNFACDLRVDVGQAVFNDDFRGKKRLHP